MIRRANRGALTEKRNGVGGGGSSGGGKPLRGVRREKGRTRGNPKNAKNVVEYQSLPPISTSFASLCDEEQYWPAIIGWMLHERSPHGIETEPTNNNRARGGREKVRSGKSENFSLSLVFFCSFSCLFVCFFLSTKLLPLLVVHPSYIVSNST